ncbi:Fe-S cluster assembly sulfur transfer protein SufU [Mycoplasma buteonis]|uniref:Fe-S cluster assembly sulfur transfer protein SufU n=1 Tax=Mycoplasma buteonis TaxID=171280 RepID=UPI00055C1C33|nr:SUF system NifU family Fe-S cluster assembly protein [Mycoplasma buteonis]
MHFNPDLARKTIMQHYMKPQHKAQLEEGKFSTTFSTTCSDKLELEINLDENNKITVAQFNGNGCAIFLASTDLFLDLIIGKTIAEAIELATLFNKFVNQEELSETQIEKLGSLWVFYNVKTHLNRVTCATLTSNQILNDFNK